MFELSLARLLWSAVLIVPLLGSGCMTVDHLVDQDQRLAMYGGTVSSYRYIQDESAPFFGTFIRMLDLPLTAVGDTLLLPIVAPIVLLR